MLISIFSAIIIRTLTRAMLISVVGLVIAAATAGTAIFYFSNLPSDNIFSSVSNELGSFLAGPIHSTAQDQYVKTTVTAKNTTLVVDLALTTDQQSRGLSGREKMSDNQGMLFVMQSPGRYGFWMKEMKFPLDIFWLDTKGKAVYLKQNLQPCLTILNCPTYSPDTDSLYVLETVAGFSQRHDITKGTQFNFRLPGR
jgi:uncharacterized membrane protein (UPF0127 family)